MVTLIINQWQLKLISLIYLPFLFTLIECAEELIILLYKGNSMLKSQKPNSAKKMFIWLIVTRQPVKCNVIQFDDWCLVIKPAFY